MPSRACCWHHKRATTIIWVARLPSFLLRWCGADRGTPAPMTDTTGCLPRFLCLLCSQWT
jgi:hypothetical protein